MHRLIHAVYILRGHSRRPQPTSNWIEVGGYARCGPVLSGSELKSSTFFSAHAIAPSTAALTLCTTSSTTFAADYVPSVCCPKGAPSATFAVDFVSFECCSEGV
jgi:hypothetical protein